MTTNKRDNFVKKANKIHNNFYDYSKVIFQNVHTPVIITCPIHGDFEQRPVKHTSQKCGCPKCGTNRANTLKSNTNEGFIKAANDVHDGKYSYEKVVYINNYTPVIITCPIHGDFEQRPVKHTSQKCGCPRCVLTKTTDDFIFKSKIIHQNKYVYNKSRFVSSHTKTIVGCRSHGDFLITPNNHLQGGGCPACGKEENRGLYCEATLNGTDLGSTPGILYFVQMECKETNDSFYKIGITKHTVDHRLAKRKHDIKILSVITGTLYEMYKIERNILATYKHCQYIPPSMYQNGSTECLHLTLQDVETITKTYMDR